MMSEQRDLHHPADAISGRRRSRRRSNTVFSAVLTVAALVYPFVLAVLLLCNLTFTRESAIWSPWQDPAIRYATGLSVFTSILSGLLSLICAIPTGYLLSRYRIPGWRVLDILLYLPIVLPGLVIGVSLLIFFRSLPGRFIEQFIMPFTFAIPGIVLGQTIVGAAFATRIMKLAFDSVSPKHAGLARTLGASRWQAFWHVELAEARAGVVEAFVLAWACALGAFGPIIIFCGTTRFRTEVLSTSIFLEFSIGNLDRALILSLWIAGVAAIVLLLVRGLGRRALW